MVQKVKVGTGITQYERTDYDVTGKTPGDTDRVIEGFAAFNDTVKRNGGLFGAETGQARKSCEAIRDAYSSDWDFRGFPIDSPEGFARSILKQLDYAAQCIAEGNTDQAARFAFSAGRQWERALMKWRWEVDALRGVKTVKAAGAGGAARAGQLKPDTEDRLATMAEYIAAGHSISRAADLTAKRGLGTQEGNKKLWGRHRK